MGSLVPVFHRTGVGNVKKRMITGQNFDSAVATRLNPNIKKVDLRLVSFSQIVISETPY